MAYGFWAQREWYVIYILLFDISSISLVCSQSQNKMGKAESAASSSSGTASVTTSASTSSTPSKDVSKDKTKSSQPETQPKGPQTKFQTAMTTALAYRRLIQAVAIVVLGIVIYMLIRRSYAAKHAPVSLTNTTTALPPPPASFAFLTVGGCKAVSAISARFENDMYWCVFHV